MQLFRRYTFGDLAEINVLDTRQYRSDQVCLQDFPSAPDCPDRQDPSLTMMGKWQERLLFQGLRRSKARWNVLAQQIWMTEVDYTSGLEEGYNMDQWDGYPAARQRVLDFIQKTGTKNHVVITGDWHCFQASDLKADFKDPTSQTVATEFAGTSISSACTWRFNVEANLAENPHVKFFNGDYRGYVSCKVKRDIWQSDYRIISNVADPNSSVSTLASFIVENGNPGVQQL